MLTCPPCDVSSPPAQRHGHGNAVGLSLRIHLYSRIEPGMGFPYNPITDWDGILGPSRTGRSNGRLYHVMTETSPAPKQGQNSKQNKGHSGSRYILWA